MNDKEDNQRTNMYDTARNFVEEERAKTGDRAISKFIKEIQGGHIELHNGDNLHRSIDIDRELGALRSVTYTYSDASHHLKRVSVTKDDRYTTSINAPKYYLYCEMLMDFTVDTELIVTLLDTLDKAYNENKERELSKEKETRYKIVQEYLRGE